LDGVAATSRFIVNDCGWTAAKIIYCGCNHVPDMGVKTPSIDDGNRRTFRLRIGTLMRLGAAEARYKGSQEFIGLASRLKAAGVNAEFHVMGRGTQSDAMPFELKGIQVHTNASDASKIRYLRSLDIFVSLSKWEGFNLPLAEAQALGTLGLALAVGAHPE